MKYREYLDAGVVLFGEPFNHHCPPAAHPSELVDCQLVVHQQLRRHCPHQPSEAERKASFELHASLSKPSPPPEEEQPHHRRPFHLRQQVVEGIEGYEQPNEEEEQQHFGTDLEEYLPEQFGIVLSKDQAYEQQEALNHVPFEEPSQ